MKMWRGGDGAEASRCLGRVSGCIYDVMWLCRRVDDRHLRDVTGEEPREDAIVALRSSVHVPA